MNVTRVTAARAGQAFKFSKPGGRLETKGADCTRESQLGPAKAFQFSKPGARLETKRARPELEYNPPPHFKDDKSKQ